MPYTLSVPPRKYRIAVSIVLIISFITFDISWACSSDSITRCSTLAARSIFDPIMDAVGVRHRKQVEFELSAIIEMCLKGLKGDGEDDAVYRSFLNVNSALDRRCADLAREIDPFAERMLEVDGLPGLLEGGPDGPIEIDIKTVGAAETTRRFKIIFRGDKLDDMFDRAKIEVVEQAAPIAARLPTAERVLSPRSGSVTLKLGEGLSALISDAMSLSAGSVIFIAGPTSGGKTSIAKQAVRNVHRSRDVSILSLDRYYKRREEMPKSANGKPDFSTPEAIHLDWAREDILSLLNGAEVDLPNIDIAANIGSRRSGEKMSLGVNGILIVESIYALHDEVLQCAAGREVRKVFIDVPDAIRLVRRMVRDAQGERRKTPYKTLSRWDSVKREETEFVFPTRERADYHIENYHENELDEYLPRAIPLLVSAMKEAVRQRNGKVIGLVVELAELLLPRYRGARASAIGELETLIGRQLPDYSLAQGATFSLSLTRSMKMAIADLLHYVQRPPQEVSLSELRQHILTAFPAIDYSETRLPHKMTHIAAVVQSFNRLIHGDFEYFRQSFLARKRGKTEFSSPAEELAYMENLAKLYQFYSEFPPEAKDDLALAVVLHDIGFTDKDTGDAAHPSRGAEMARLILAEAGFPEASIARVSNIIRYHDFLGNIVRAKKAPRALQGLSAELLRLLAIANCMDMAGYGSGKNDEIQNNLVPESLDRILEYSNPDELRRLDRENGFFEDRLRRLARRGYGSELAPAEFEGLKEAICEVIPDEAERASFMRNWNSRIEVRSPYLFFNIAHQGGIYDPASLIRIMRVISSEADRYFYLHPEADFFAADTDIDSEDIPAKELKRVFGALKDNVYDMPFTIEGNRMVISLSRFVEDPLRKIMVANELLLLNRASAYLMGYPVDIVVNLSLIPREDMEANMETWAYITALNNKHGLNVNYIFNSDDEGYAAETRRALLEKIAVMGQPGVDISALGARVMNRGREGAIRIHIMKKEELEGLKDMPDDLLPIAMSEGPSAEGAALIDFVSASAIGLAQAACKKMELEKTPNLRDVIDEEILPRMRYAYQRLFPGQDMKDIITVETVLNMIDARALVRKNLAIALALPPILRAAFGHLKDYHDRVHTLLRSA